MAALSTLARHATWLGALSLVLATFLLVRTIAALVRTVRQARLVTAPLVESQHVELTRVGRVILAVEGPLLGRRHVGLRYRLVGPDGGEVRGRRLLFRAVTSGWSTSSIQLKAFEVAMPGQHRLTIEGLGAARPDDARYRVVFMRPHLPVTVGYIVVLIASAWLAIGGVLLIALPRR